MANRKQKDEPKHTSGNAAKPIVRRRTMFRCIICGKITAGRMPKQHSRHQGDTSFRFPRRHNGSDGKPCAGNIEEAEWVTVD